MTNLISIGRKRSGAGRRLTEAPPAGGAWAGLRGVAGLDRPSRFSRAARKMLSIGALGLAAVVGLWTWPVLVAWGPIRLIYLMHDEAVLPLRGWLWDRNQPYSAIAATSAGVLGSAMLVLRPRLERAYPQLLDWLAARPLGRGVLAAWADVTGTIVPLGASMSHARAVADHRLELALLDGVGPARRRDDVALALRMRSQLAARRHMPAIRDTLRQALLCRMRLEVKGEAELQEVLEDAVSVVRRRVGKDPLAADALQAFDLLAPGAAIEEEACNGLAARLRARCASLVVQTSGTPALRESGKQLGRVLAVAIARIANDGDLAVSWLSAEEVQCFKEDAAGLLAAEGALVDPWLDQLTLGPLAGMLHGRGSLLGLADRDADRLWWGEAGWRTAENEVET